MYIRKSEEQIRNELNESLEKRKALISAWKKVEIKKKKDGSEFKELTKSCLVNATADKIPLYPTNNANGYIISTARLKITTDSKAGWISDSIYITEDWGKGMDENRKVVIPLRVPFQYNTAEEIRAKINNQITSYEEDLEEIKYAQEHLHEVYNLYITGLKEIEDCMYHNCRGNKIFEDCFYDIVSMR